LKRDISIVDRDPFVFLYRSLIRKMQEVFTTKAMIAKMRNAQKTPRLRIMADAEREYTPPPRPAPANEMPLARDRFVVNHWGTTEAVGMNRRPSPMPNRRPCVRKRCQICVAKLAAMRLAVSNKTPIVIVGRMPNFRVEYVAMGETRKRNVRLRAPTKAYWSVVASGKVSFAR
jgi:hypothetical protein